MKLGAAGTLGTLTNMRTRAMTKPMSRLHGTSQPLRELSVLELDAVAGGVTAINKPAPYPREYLTITLENTMVSG
jgi:hypothetical protein